MFTISSWPSLNSHHQYIIIFITSILNYTMALQHSITIIMIIMYFTPLSSTKISKQKQQYKKYELEFTFIIYIIITISNFRMHHHVHVIHHHHDKMLCIHHIHHYHHPKFYQNKTKWTKNWIEREESIIFIHSWWFIWHTYMNHMANLYMVWNFPPMKSGPTHTRMTHICSS